MSEANIETDPWDELEQLGEEIGANWQLDINSIELIALLRDEKA